jgi:hypothetical protein
VTGEQGNGKDNEKQKNASKTKKLAQKKNEARNKKELFSNKDGHKKGNVGCDESTVTTSSDETGK